MTCIRKTACYLSNGIQLLRVVTFALPVEVDRHVRRDSDSNHDLSSTNFESQSYQAAQREKKGRLAKTTSVKVDIDKPTVNKISSANYYM